MMTRPTYARCVALAVLLALTPLATRAAPDDPPDELGKVVTAASYAVQLAQVVDELVAAPLEDFLPGVVLSPRHRKRVPQRVDEQRLYEVSATGSNGIPEAALRAYHDAEGTMAGIDGSCQLPWTLLAAVGRVESDHGRYGGSVLSSDGVSRPAIIGPQLNGAGPFAAIADSDDGRLDGDKVWDRAVGPMQFLPGTWRMVASDGDGDGETNPGDIDDASLGSGRYLCSGSGSVQDPAGMAEALYRYNQSDYYVLLVMSYERGYRTGVFAEPSPPPPPDEPDPSPSPGDGPGGQTPDGDPQPGGEPDPAPATPATPTGPSGPATPTPSGPATQTPAPSPSQTPTPTPEPAPTLVAVRGVWTACATGWCLDTRPLDLGDETQLSRTAPADFDGDGTVESNRDEFNGLADPARPELELRVEEGVQPLRVFAIAGQPVRGADGAFLG